MNQRGSLYLYLMIVALLLIVAGVGGYYLGNKNIQLKQSATPSAPVQSNTVQLAPTTAISNVPIDGTAGWKVYKDTQYSLGFNYPQNYTITTTKSEYRCVLATNTQQNCLVSLDISPSDNSYDPTGAFYLIKGVNSVNVKGQIKGISFDSQNKSWMNCEVMQCSALAAWRHTKSGLEIIKAANGGSQGSWYFYLIPDYQKDIVAIFQIPATERLRCDLITQSSEQMQCNNFYKSVIDKYNNGGNTVSDTWLPENYIQDVYKDAGQMIMSFDYNSN